MWSWWVLKDSSIIIRTSSRAGCGSGLESHAVDPEILLLDEPFGSLDAQTRDEMGSELLAIWERNKKTALFVTHGIDEAIFLADQIVVMARDPGRITKIISVDLPRPRTVETTDSKRFIEYRRQIRECLQREAGGEF